MGILVVGMPVLDLSHDHSISHSSSHSTCCFHFEFKLGTLFLLWGHLLQNQSRSLYLERHYFSNYYLFYLKLGIHPRITVSPRIFLHLSTGIIAARSQEQNSCILIKLSIFAYKVKYNQIRVKFSVKQTKYMKTKYMGL